MLSWAWWFTLVIPALGRWIQEAHEFKASLGYRVRPCLRNIPPPPTKKLIECCVYISKKLKLIISFFICKGNYN
jgi:hypothetical protein